MAKRTRAKHQGIWGSVDFTSNVRGLGLCALILMLALPVKSYAVIDPGQLGLDSVANFAVYSGGSLSNNGTSTTVNGDVGLGPNGTQNFSTGFNINGTYRVDNTANNSHSYSGGSFTGGTVLQGLQYVSTTVSSVSAYAASLTPTLILSPINNANTTIIGNGGYNVITLASITLNGARTLTLQGGINDVFVFNVTNTVSFSNPNWTPIVLSGVATNHVLFNLLNTSAGANALSVGATNVTLLGTFIAPSASISLAFASDKVYGGLFAGGNSLTLNSETITADVFVLPEPSSFALVGISCLFGLGVWSRRRKRR